MRTNKIPFVTYGAIAICVVVYLLNMIMPGLSSSLAVSVPAVAAGRWWTIVTAMFAHEQFWHVFMNMMMLFYMGSALEKLFGSLKVGVVYLGSGIGANIAYLVINMMVGSSVGALGASGAIFGLLGMYTVLLVREMKNQRMLAVKPTVKSTSGFFTCLGVNIVISLVPGIAWEAHLGGFVTGLVLGFIMYMIEIRKYPKLPQ